MTDEIKEKYGNKYFSELPDQKKGDIWTYNLSVVNIDKKCTLEDVKTMFYRLNITDYSLNEQEKRNSLDNAFGATSLGLLEDEFWNEVKVFSSGDVKRMKDVEYCSNILILADEGIVDQSTSKKLNQVYDFYRTPRGEYTPKGSSPELTTHPTGCVK